MRTWHLLLLLALNVGWAAVPSVATQLESQLGVREFVFLRYGFALLGMLVLWPWLPGSLPSGLDFLRTVAMGVAVFTVGHLLQVGGIQMSEASDASILLAVDPLISSLGAALFLHEAIPGRRWLGFGLSMVGVALMSLWHREAPLPGLMANLLIVLSFASDAVWSVMGKPLVARWGIPKITALALASGTVVNAALLIPDAASHSSAFKSLSASGWLAMAGLGLVLTAFGYTVWHLVIREAPVSLASMTIYLQPVVGMILAVFITGASIHLGHILGSTAILAGLAVGLWNPAKGGNGAECVAQKGEDSPRSR